MSGRLTVTGQPAAALFSTAFGALMCVAAAVDGDRPGLTATALAVAAVVVGIRFRVAAIFAVLFAMTAIVLSEPPTLFAALSGLAAAAYLVLRHGAGDAAGVVTTTWPTVFGMVGFTLVGVVATTAPLSAPWLPLVAPPAVVLVFVLAIAPYISVHGKAHR